MEKRMLLTISLCALIYLAWYSTIGKKLAVNQTPEQVTSQPIPQSIAPAQTTSQATTVKKQNIKPIELLIGDENFKAKVSSLGGVISGLKIGKYKGQNTDQLEQLIGGDHQLELSTSSAEWAYLSNVIYAIESDPRKDTRKAILFYEDDKVKLRRTYSIHPELYSIDQETSVQFKQTAPNFVFVGLRGSKDIGKQENERREILLHKSSGQETWDIGSVSDPIEDVGAAMWTGIASRYFLQALVDNGSAVKPKFQARLLDANTVSSQLIYATQNGAVTIPTKLYFGPKDITILKQVGATLDSAVDFGWFTIFAYPLLQALKWFYKFINNYGVAIILLTIGVKVLTYPLTYKSMKSMKDMQRIQPQLQKLREKYKDDKESLNKEMLQLMRSNGYNPMSGCFPILIQMPIFIALYNVLYGAIDLYGEPFFGWIHDLSAKDPFYVTPVLLALTMFVQQKLTPNTATDPAQQKMMMFMPVIFGVMMLWLPSGLTLYMLVNSVMSILQQIFINKKFTSPDSGSLATV